jgi:subfamily B ATP-binding cassette protein MsbA
MNKQSDSSQESQPAHPAEVPSSVIYRRLVSYVWPLKWPFAVAVLGLVIFASAQPMLAHLMGVVEETLREPSHTQIMLLVGALMGTFLYRGLGTFLGKYFIAIVGRGVVHAIRTELFDKMTLLPSRYYDGESSGRMISRVIFDVDQVTGAATRAITTAIQEGLTVIFLMAYLIYLDYTLTLVFIGIVPAIVVVVAAASRYFRKYSRNVQQTIGDVTQVTNDSIKGFREVRIFGAGDYERGRFFDASNRSRQQGLKFDFTSAISVPLIQQIVSIGLGIMVYIMFDRVADGDMSSAEFLQFITAAALIAKPLRSLSDVNSVIQKGIAAATSIFEVLDAETEPDKGVQTLQSKACRVDFQRVSMTYSDTESPALKNIDLRIDAGSSVALVGKSGSGKSTFVNLLPRFYEVSEGQILIENQDIRDFTLESLREHIAFVSQQVVLFNGSVRDNIAYGSLRSATDEDIRMAAKAAHADEFIDKLPLGYDTELGENGVLLSGGQRQRIAIARAILKDAPILILDEATSALDTKSERYIQAAMDQVMEGRTTFVIAHRLSTIENADRILVMDEGEIVEDGRHNDLLAAAGIYANLYHMQFGKNVDAQ